MKEGNDMSITNIILDVIIVFVIISFGLLGLARGVFKQLISSVGTVVIFILAFYLKNPIAKFLSINLPFWNFNGFAHGLTSLNILFYQLFAFLIVLAVLFLILELLMKLAEKIENALTMTVILGIPSKILGFIVGLIEGYVLIFIALFILSLPFWSFDFINNSKLKPVVLESSPILSKITKDTYNAGTDIYEEIKKNSDNDRTKLNITIIKLLLKYNIVDKDYLKELRLHAKLNIPGVDALIGG